jgi:hypothetical protein
MMQERTLFRWSSEDLLPCYVAYQGSDIESLLLVERWIFEDGRVFGLYRQYYTKEEIETLEKNNGRMMLYILKEVMVEGPSKVRATVSYRFDKILAFDQIIIENTGRTRQKEIPLNYIDTFPSLRKLILGVTPEVTLKNLYILHPSKDHHIIMKTRNGLCSIF